MCCCGKPTINGEVGAYSWDGQHFSTREPAPPPLADGDTLLADERGRCGGLDAHSHHFRLVKSGLRHMLLVQHGGGSERIELPVVARLALPALQSVDTNARYWLLHTIYSAQQYASMQAATDTSRTWRKAAAEKRIKTRKLPARGIVNVWIEQERANAATSAPCTHHGAPRPKCHETGCVPCGTAEVQS